MDVSNIDDVLNSAKTPQQPEAPEHQYDVDDTLDDEIEGSIPPQSPIEEEPEEETKDESSEEESVDEYGNEKPKPKMYTEEEVNERINRRVRERLARADRNTPHQQQPSLENNAKKDFEYNPESDASWEQQLEQFVENTFNKINQRQVQQQIKQQEEAASEEFRDKFSRGMDRFSDFIDVVSAQPVTDAMTHAMRGIDDPSAFIYAASKRHPEELQRISTLKDPYAQIVEMGKLEERLKRKAPATQAPRPVSRTVDNSNFKEKSNKKIDDSIEGLIAQSEAKIMAKKRSLQRR